MKSFEEIREQFKHVNCGTDDCCMQCDTAVTEQNYAVEVEGLPKMFIDAKNPGEVKKKMRKLLRKPESLKSVERVMDADIKKHFRGKISGKDQQEEGYDHSAAVKAFLKKGGKIKKLPPGKAQGYHGKDDPGKGVKGMLDKPDSSKFKRGKKVRSMRADMSEKAIDAKKMDAYKKFAKAKKVDDDSIRMAMDNPKHAETKRLMKDKNFAKAFKMYQAAMK